MAVAAISPVKKSYALMHATFSEDNVSEFLSDLLNGKEDLPSYEGDISLKQRLEWTFRKVQ